MSYQFLDNPEFRDRSEQTVHVIGMGRRFAAYVIDFIVIMLLSGLAGACLGLVSAATAPDRMRELQANELNYTLFTQCLGFLVVASYYILAWSIEGQTVGQKFLGIKVISTNGSPVGLGKAIMRYIGYFISSIPLMLGFAWIAFDERRQGWHDKIAGTYVVPKETRFPPDVPLVFDRSESIPSGLLVAMFYGMFILIPIAVIALLTMFGPQIGNIFSEITRDLPQR
jgi:uncharacterized RDD family membrane protein YckC